MNGFVSIPPEHGSDRLVEPLLTEADEPDDDPAKLLAEGATEELLRTVQPDGLSDQLTVIVEPTRAVPGQLTLASVQ